MSEFEITIDGIKVKGTVMGGGMICGKCFASIITGKGFMGCPRCEHTISKADYDKIPFAGSMDWGKILEGIPKDEVRWGSDL